MAGEWDVVSTSPAPAAPKAGADPWAVVSHVDAPAPSMSDNALSAVRSSLPYGIADIAGSGVANLATKIGAGYHGISKLITTPGSFDDKIDAASDAISADRKATHLEANSPGAETVKKGLGYVAKPFEAVAAPLDSAISHAGPGISTVVPAVSEGIQDIAQLSPLGKLSEAAAAGKGASVAAVEGGAKPVVGTGEQAVQTGRAAGYKYTPGAVESRNPAAAAAGDVPQSFAVNAADRRVINLHNQARTTELAGEHLGKPNATNLSPQDFENARQPHHDTYKQTGQVVGTGLTGSPDFVSALGAQLADTSPKGALKPAVATQTQKILAAARTGNMSGPQMVSDISWLRKNGGRSVANTLEDEMESQLGANSPQLGKFREARTGLAQIHNLQDATTGGQVDATDLMRLDEKYPGMLTGTPKLIAQSAAAGPQDFRLPSGVQPGSSPLSKPTWAGVAKTVAGKVAKVTMPGRFDVPSEAFQNRFGREASPTESTYFPNLGKRPGAPSEAFQLSPGPGKAGVEPLQRGMQLPQGGPPREQLSLIPPEGDVGMQPRQGGLELPPGQGPRDILQLQHPAGHVIEAHQLGMQLAQGMGPREMLHLTQPEGGAGYEPNQRNMALPEGAPPREKLGLEPAPGNVGVNPVQLGMEMAQGRPMPEQRLGLEQSPANIEPHQPSLLGHEGTPEGGSRKPTPKAKKRGKD